MMLVPTCPTTFKTSPPPLTRLYSPLMAYHCQENTKKKLEYGIIYGHMSCNISNIIVAGMVMVIVMSTNFS